MVAQIVRLCLFLLTSAISALPLQSNSGNRHDRSRPLSIPLNGLPPPGTNSSSILRYIALGVGHQNYTCGTDPSAAPTSIGATAKLFDIKELLTWHPFLTCTVPEIALALSLLSVDIVPASSINTAKSPYAMSDLSLGLPPLTPIGEHFFDLPTKLPTFNLHAAWPPCRIEATKLAGVPAPAGSPVGVNGQGAVDWLLLGDSGNVANFGGLRAVYRVETAGGKPAPTCQGVDAGSIIRVPYAAEYWFYGEKVGDYGQ
jgi:Protein of unknown function (DUF3455)